MPQPVVLPPQGDGSRRRNRSDAPSPREPRSLPAPPRFPPLPRPSPRLLLLLLVAALAVGYVVFSDGDDASPPTDEGELAPAISADRSRRTALVVVRGDAGAVVGLTLLIGHEGGGGNVLYVPTGTMTEVPTLGLVPIRDAATSGSELVRQALENILGRLVERAVDVSVADLAAAIGPASQAPEQVPARLAPAAGTELERIVEHQAVWREWLTGLSAQPELVPATGPLADLAPLLRTLASGEAGHHTLPVETVATGVDGSEYYGLRDEELADLVQALLPGDVALDERASVRLLNGTGSPGLSQQVQPLLVASGFRITLTGNADRFDYATTQIVYYDEDGLEAARAARTAIGIGEIVRSVEDSDAVDLTVVIGADFTGRPAGSTTTTSSQGANS